MIRIRRRPPLPSVIPAATMSDIAFLLLIFFISTTVFDTETGIPLVLPPDKAAPVSVSPEDLLVLRGYADGKIALNGDSIRRNEVAGAIRSRLQVRPGLVVSIETERNASYEVMVELLDQVRKSNARRVSLGGFGGPS